MRWTIPLVLIILGGMLWLLPDREPIEEGPCTMEATEQNMAWSLERINA